MLKSNQQSSFLFLSAFQFSAFQLFNSEFVETYLPLAGREQAEFQQIVRSDEKYVEVKQMITTYEQQGIQKGKQEDLILLLEKKFGKLGAPMQRKIRKIESTEKLESLLLAVLDANSLKDLPL